LQLDTTSEVTLSFKLRNPINAQPSSPVNIMVSGALPISATRMTNADSANLPLRVVDLPLSQTAVCSSSGCVPGAACNCSGSFTNVPTGRKAYSLKADIQCNGGSGTFNITSPSTAAVQAAVVQPPKTCKLACDIYSPLLNIVDLPTALIGSSVLAFGASVDSVGQDLCMAGMHLKILFTLRYSVETADIVAS
jgi:hypothetical protein